MPIYFYQTLGADGTLRRGTGQFSGLDDLLSEVEARGDVLYRVGATPAPLDGLLRLQPRHLSLPAVVEFCHFVSEYLASGATLQGALEDLAAASRFSSLKQRVRVIRRSITAGHSLSEAMTEAGGFRPFVVSMVAAGEQSGTLARVLRACADHLEQTLALRRSVRRGAIYPVAVLLVLGVALGFWISVVVPNIGQLFRVANMPVPELTQDVVDATAWIQANGALLLWLPALLPVLWFAALRWQPMRRAVDGVRWRVPLVAPLLRTTTLSFFFLNLSAMYGAGLTLSRALELLERDVQNHAFGRRLASIREAVAAGSPLAAAMSSQKIFDPLPVHLVRLGESTGQLEPQLARLAAHYAAKARARIEVIVKLAEPAILLVVGAVFALLVAALVLPVYDIVNQVGGMRLW
ncbi:type II secretion system F family protein [Quisquiliibacterium transsilvanicum]|uniref:Type II secretory pathway component PulF n=1 Tax=Quisquiliibacterium transsilvanicum TaxID=1549638 RepID=A0A7W8HHC9_9BURK|nr:type II secretion system F family protein [Quisquiliibacterium transsilvanicum]MBB5272059.1 type II secretory pathway component PulF [Quisquiliibacterium transsilvanicum]